VGDEDLYEGDDELSETRAPDPRELDARAELEGLFQKKQSEVFFSRQLEVRLEDDYFHWVTNRAIRELVARGSVAAEVRPLKFGGNIHLQWNRSYRYYKRSASNVVKLVEEYADPNIAGAIGLHGEIMILEGFARFQFVMRGRNTGAYQGKEWKGTGHNLDFIFERDGVAYGVEVKNTLGYMDYKELQAKVKMCQFLGIRPVFVARMLPKSWIKEVVDVGGFALILKYQLYPWTHRELAGRVSKGLGLPVDAPKALNEGTMKRFLRWHEKQA
jgi:hypothetical protein